VCDAVLVEQEDESKLSREEVNFASQVRRLREEFGWKQEQLVEAMREAGVGYMNKTAISRIENATRPVRMIEAVALTRLFGKTLREMTNPDGREAVLTFASSNHSSHRKAILPRLRCWRDPTSIG
jgi:transcriptional regulator with XRE-family HTH domain